MVALRAQTGLILLAFKGTEAVSKSIAEITALEPLIEFVCGGNITHTVWCVGDADRLIEAFSAVPSLYVADGHHRIEASLKARDILRGQNGIEAMIGDFSGLDAIADEMRALLRARDSSPVVAVNASMTVVWYETAKALPSYRRTVTGMLELARTTGMFYTARHVVLSGGLVGALSDGDLATAGAWLRELERDVHLLGPGFRAWHHWFVVWEALIRKDVARAASYQPEMLRLAQAAGRPVDEAVACLMSAQTLHALGETSAAFVHVERARAIARAAGSSFLEFMVQLTEAQLALDAGRESEGLDALRAAMALGRRHGFVTSFVWIPAVMAGLCGRALEAGIEPEYVGTLIRQRGLVPDDPPLNVEAWPWPVKVYTLGRFEVLRDGQPVRFPRKVQRKPLALLKAVIACRRTGSPRRSCDGRALARCIRRRSPSRTQQRAAPAAWTARPRGRHPPSGRTPEPRSARVLGRRARHRAPARPP